MDSVRLDSLLDLFHGRGLVLALLWLGLIVLIVALLVLMYTRWGAMRPLRKCLALSIGAHLLLVGYSTTVYVAPAVPFLREQIIRVTLAEKSSEPPGTPKAPGKAVPGERSTALGTRPWETFAVDAGPALDPIAAPRVPERELRIPERTAVAQSGNAGLAPTPLNKPLVAIDPAPPARTPPETSPPPPPLNRPAEPIEAPAPQGREGARAEIGSPTQFPRLTPIERPARTPTRTANEEMPATILDRPLSVPPLREAPGGAGGGGPATAANSPPSKLPASATESTTTRGPAPVASQRTADAPPTRPADGEPANTAPLVASRLKPPSLAEEGTGSIAGGSLPMATGVGLAGLGPPQLPRVAPTPGEHQVPEVYRLRLAPNRSKLSERLGATPELETAVKAGLKWLADHQEPDGRWSPRKYEGGREIMEAGRDRQGAGARADTGVTGLAILAFAGSGNTHLDGPHRIAVRRGIEFLLSKQDADGSFGGEAQLYEFMYCHGMATLALSELVGMTGDSKLRQPLAQAVAYTLAAQDPTGGGWRYRPREAGDTSQFGWQVMALKSASLAGIPVPESTWRGAQRFLDSVSGGRHHGLAAYRPGEDFTRSMTAEALACRQFLGLANDNPTAKEAGDYLLGDLPGQGEPNLYYWYYGSIAMYQLQGDYWKRWSDALRKTLLSTQRTAGTLAGSWDPNTRWDGYGGRVYSTALATLCLEAHYRYLPLNTLGKTEESAPGGLR